MKDSCLITTARVQRHLKKRNEIKPNKEICRLATGRIQLDTLEDSLRSSENAVEGIACLIEPGRSPAEASEDSDSDWVQGVLLTENQDNETQWSLQKVAEEEEEEDSIAEELKHQTISAETFFPKNSLASPLES